MARLIDDSWKLQLVDTMLAPLIRILLRMRITYSCLLHIARRVYLREAASILEQANPAGSVSLTELTFESGVPLAEIRQAIDEDGDFRAPVEVHTSAESAVIDTWRRNPRYSQDDEPCRLPLTAEDGLACFRELVRKATKSNVGYRDMLARLVAARAVTLSMDKQFVELNAKAYISLALATPGERLPAIAESAASFLDTLEKNSRGESPDALTELRAYTRFARPDAKAKFRAAARGYYNDIMARSHEFEDSTEPSNDRAIGIGVYVFDRRIDGISFLPSDGKEPNNF